MKARQPAVRPWRTWLLLALGLGADACSVEPAYRHPAVSTPTTWQQAPASLRSEWPAAEWWHEFGSDPLDRLITQAQTGNDDIAAAIARVREADAQARIAGAALLPNLGLQASASRQRQRPIASGAPITYDEYSPLLTASYELDFWGKNRATHEAALQAAQASRYDRETVALTVITSVALTYFEALEQHDRLEVARDDLANAQKILSGIELEQTVGTATALDVAQQATTVATLNASIPPLAQQLQQSLDSLAILVGQTPESLDIEQGSLDQISAPPVIAGLPSELLARRPDVAAAEAQLKSANADIDVARAAYF
ncbi:MAG: efflux transporter outer membrane subunit, partial [Steroidobacteraceae bacterium]